MIDAMKHSTRLEWLTIVAALALLLFARAGNAEEAAPLQDTGKVVDESLLPDPDQLLEPDQFKPAEVSPDENEEGELSVRRHHPPARFTCYAEDNWGRWYYAIGNDPWYTQNRAVDACYYWTGTWCFARGCVARY